MAYRQYSIKELKRIIKESSNEFKPKLGDKVESENKKNNNEAYKESEKLAKEVSTKNRKIKCPNDDNLGMQDLEYDNINKDFKDRVNAQMKGYTSKDNENKHKNDEYGNADFTEIDGMKQKHAAIKKGKNIAKKNGLTSREIDGKDFDELTSSVFENKKISKIKFKNSCFISEEQIMNKIPDNFKYDGNKFIVEDKNNNKFYIVWNGSDTKILNQNKIVNEHNRILQLFNYKNPNTKNSTLVNEDNKVNNMLDKSRLLFN